VDVALPVLAAPMMIALAAVELQFGRRSGETTQLG
jgi:hypothetical protein